MMDRMRVSSPDFEPHSRLADRHAADDRDEAPRLVVADIPPSAVELALICHDPDAPLPRGFDHWLRYGLPAVPGDITAADVPHRDAVNDVGRVGWSGPMPPLGHGIHHYYFWVYALSVPVEGEPTRLEFLERYGDRIVAQERIVGLYSRGE